MNHHVRHPWPPIEDPDSRILILGTMPSPASLADGFYFGHPQNAFWPIMGAIFGAHRNLSPEERAAILRKHGISLWDVLRECERPGALDADIKNPKPNDFQTFFKDHEHVHTVVFNGKKAEDLWRRHVASTLHDRVLRTTCLPSTSPANAVPFERKLQAWRVGWPLPVLER